MIIEERERAENDNETKFVIEDSNRISGTKENLENTNSQFDSSKISNNNNNFSSKSNYDPERFVNQKYESGSRYSTYFTNNAYSLDGTDLYEKSPRAPPLVNMNATSFKTSNSTFNQFGTSCHVAKPFANASSNDGNVRSNNNTGDWSKPNPNRATAAEGEDWQD